MAGKHSKSFLDVLKETVKFNNTACTSDAAKPPLPLIYKIIIGVLVMSLVLASIWVCVFFVPSRTNQKMLDEAIALFESGDSTVALNKLSGQNSDIKGWIKIEGTGINHPVCQGADNSYYMKHNHLDKKSRYGAIQLSAEDSFNLKDNDRNTVIYGNNMQDGSMFGTLKKLRDINFYKKHPTVKLYYGDERQTYVVFAVMVLASADEYENIGFNPSKSYFESEDRFNEWVVETSKRSIIKTNVPVDYGDDILTLVTMADDFEGARLTVMAKRLENVEVPYVNTSNAVLNPKPEYPKIWYTSRGLKYPN